MKKSPYTGSQIQRLYTVGVKPFIPAQVGEEWQKAVNELCYNRRSLITLTRIEEVVSFTRALDLYIEW